MFLQIALIMISSCNSQPSCDSYEFLVSLYVFALAEYKCTLQPMDVIL